MFGCALFIIIIIFISYHSYDNHNILPVSSTDSIFSQKCNLQCHYFNQHISIHLYFYNYHHLCRCWHTSFTLSAVINSPHLDLFYPFNAYSPAHWPPCLHITGHPSTVTIPSFVSSQIAFFSHIRVARGHLWFACPVLWEIQALYVELDNVLR